MPMEVKEITITIRSWTDPELNPDTFSITLLSHMVTEGLFFVICDDIRYDLCNRRNDCQANKHSMLDSAKDSAQLYR